MAIRVTCPGCHTRFNVSDKFAGQEGPCPKCKKLIKIPSADEVKIHAPEQFGPTDKDGRKTLKPIARKETKVTPVGFVLVVVPIVVCLLMGLICRVIFKDPAKFPTAVLAVGGLVMAFAAVYAGYTFMRDQERGTFLGRELYVRLAICSVMYALLWICMPVASYAFNGYGLGAWLTAFTIMFVLGSAICTYSLELDYLVSIIHFGLFMACCVVMRLTAGVGALPGTFGGEDSPAPVEPGNVPGGGSTDPTNNEGGLGMLIELIEPLIC